MCQNSFNFERLKNIVKTLTFLKGFKKFNFRLSGKSGHLSWHRTYFRSFFFENAKEFGQSEHWRSMSFSASVASQLCHLLLPSWIQGDIQKARKRAIRKCVSDYRVVGGKTNAPISLKWSYKRLVRKRLCLIIFFVRHGQVQLYITQCYSF